MPKNRKNKRKRSYNKKINIICEGAKDKSESAYFKALIRDCRFDTNSVHVEVVDTEINTGLELVKVAKSLLKKDKKFQDIDEYWVVYDKDKYTKHPQTFDQAYGNGINIAFSSICFEVWILLHYEFTTKPFEKWDELIHYMKKEKGFINYEKGNISTYQKTKSKLQNAINNAKKMNKIIQEGHPNSKIYELNPYTDIYKLIEKIKSLGENS
jgi:hypothetical protein